MSHRSLVAIKKSVLDPDAEAASHITDQHPGAHIIGIRPTPIRNDNGDPVYEVEWEPKEASQ